MLKGSRSKPQPGDVFAMQPPDGHYLFGRVIEVDLDLSRAPMPGALLVYIYRWRSDRKQADLRALLPDRLLIPPVFINQLPWRKGYFETVAKEPLTPGDVLERHCFRRPNGDYLDLGWVRLPGPIEPCGDWGLASYRTLDDEISEALGFPRVPED